MPFLIGTAYCQLLIEFHEANNYQCKYSRCRRWLGTFAVRLFWAQLPSSVQLQRILFIPLPWSFIFYVAKAVSFWAPSVWCVFFAFWKSRKWPPSPCTPQFAASDSVSRLSQQLPVWIAFWMYCFRTPT